MPLTKTTLFWPLNEGLDSYSNPHRLKPGQLTIAEGAAYDAAGYVYPGAVPGSRIAASASENQALVPFDRAIGQQGDALAMQNRALGSPSYFNSVAFAASGGVLNLALYGNCPAEPFRQTTGLVPVTAPLVDPPKTLTGIQPLYCCPQTAATTAYTLYAWCASPTLSTTYYIGFYRQDNVTGETEGPFYFTNTTDVNATAVTVPYPQVAVASSASQQRLFFAVNATTLKIIEVTGPLNAPTLTITNTGSAAQTFQGGSGVHAYFVYSDASMRIKTSADNFVGTVTTGTGLGLASPVSIFAQPNSNIVIAGFYSSAANTIPFTRYNTSLVAQTSGIVPCSDASPTQAPVIQFTVGLDYRLNTTGLIWGIERKPTASVGSGVVYNSVEIRKTDDNGTGSSGPVRLAAGGVALMGKAYTYLPNDTGANATYFPIRTGAYMQPNPAQTPANPCAYLLNSDADVVAKWGSNDVGTPWQWPPFYVSSADLFAYIPQAIGCLSSPALYAARPGAVGTYDFLYPWPQMTYVPKTFATGAPTVASSSSIAFARFSAPVFRELPASAQFGPVVAVPSTLNLQYDGTEITEADFLTRAPPPLLTQSATGGSITAGTYTYVTVLSYVDFAGRVSYSAPSQPVSITVASGTTNSITIKVPYTQLTLRKRNPILIDTFRLVSSTTSATPQYYTLGNTQLNTRGNGNAPLNPYPDSSLFLTITDTQTDAQLLTNPAPAPIYTFGQSTFAATGTDAPPTFFSQTVWNGRLWGLANRRGPELWFTWTLDTAEVRPEGPAWSSENRIRLPAEIGQPLAIIGLDDKLIIFGSKTDYVVAGDGPQRFEALTDNPTSFSAPIALPTPGGLQVANAVVRIPQGILFQGTQGYTVLTRALQYVPVGQGIQDLTDTYSFSAGILYAEKDCVFCPGQDAAGNALTVVYFYNLDRWATASTAANDGYDGTRINWSDVRGGRRLRAQLVPPQTVSGATYKVGQARAALLSTRGPSYLEDFGQYMRLRTGWLELCPLTRDGNLSTVAGSGQLYEVQLQADVNNTLPGVSGVAGQWSYTVTLITEYNYENNVQQPPETQSRFVQNAATDTFQPPDMQWRFGFNCGFVRRVRFTVIFDSTYNPNLSDFAQALPLKAPWVRASGLVLSYGVEDGISRLGTAYNSVAGV